MSKKVNGEEFDYYLPNEVKTPQNTQLIEKLLDKDEYVLALVDYRGQGKKRLAIRWYTNLGNTKEKERLKSKCSRKTSVVYLTRHFTERYSKRIIVEKRMIKRLI